MTTFLNDHLKDAATLSATAVSQNHLQVIDGLKAEVQLLTYHVGSLARSLAEAYGLTEQEHNIVIMLMAGESAEAVSEKMGVPVWAVDSVRINPQANLLADAINRADRELQAQ